MPQTATKNADVADALSRVADLLEAQDANPFRVRSYRDAARTVRQADRQMADILHGSGESGLEELAGIGEKLAGTIREIVETGHLGLLDRLESEADPEQALARVPGIGAELARRVHSELDIGSLEELERAAHDGRLARVRGLGEKRVQGIKDALAGMLSRSATRRASRRQESGDGERPGVDTLLELDERYRDKAQSGELRRISPRRFNPDDEAWLPIMETEQDGWQFTVLFSNTARAHDLDKVRDWVVIYYENGADGQCTVVTAGRGALSGRRVVRGRESECRDYYEDKEQGG